MWLLLSLLQWRHQLDSNWDFQCDFSALCLPTIMKLVDVYISCALVSNFTNSVNALTLNMFGIRMVLCQ